MKTERAATFLRCLIVLSLVFLSNKTSAQSSPVFSDSSSNWKGFTRYHLVFQERNAFITTPKQALPGRQWVWRARFPEWHTEMDEILLDKGYYIVYLNTDKMLGSPGAMEQWDKFYEFLVDEWDFQGKMALEGVSRGGLFVFNWAKRHPERVNCIYAEAPVCDFKSWPGGFGDGKGDRGTWKVLKREYGFANNDQAMDYADNPIDGLEALARAKVPILTMIGLNDQVVPPAENAFILSDRYVKLGGISTLVPCTRGEQNLLGHHFTIETPQLGADFIIASTYRIPVRLQSQAYHIHRSTLKNAQIRFEREKKGRVAFLGGSITQNGGWRDSICNYLEEKFPETRFNFIAAGISSMGTTPGAFRLQRDVLSKGRIDLLFEEAAVNDAANGRSDTEQIRGMEGIIRHTLVENPATDIVVMHFVDPAKMEIYKQGEIPQVIRNFDEVTSLYSVSTINLAREVTDRISNLEFTWEDDFKNLHPSPFGQEVYFHSMKTFLDQAFASPLTEQDKIQNHPIPKAFDPYCYSTGQIISFKQAKEIKGFTEISNWKPSIRSGTRQGYVNVDMLVGETPGDSFTFSFEGNAVGIMLAAGPDAGIIEFTIDGESPQKLDLFTEWSSALYLPWYKTLATGLEQGEHTLKLTISRDKNEKSTGYSCIIKAFYIN